jgi:hypothetical protein
MPIKKEVKKVKFDGISTNLNNLYRLSEAKTRSISPENPTGEKGKGAMAKIGEGIASVQAEKLGEGWKVNPFIKIAPNECVEIAKIDGSGAIQQIWMTVTGVWRHTILRIYWDNQENPSVEVPIGDFFCNGWNKYTRVNSLPICVNPGSAFNSYFVMPFKKNCRITIENLDPKTQINLFYQINYVLTKVDEDIAYFHAQFKRVNPLPYKQVFTILDNVEGSGQYIGTYLAWGVNNNGWWGEGEIKFYLDGDEKYPTICGTGTEDYFCGSYNFENQESHQYEEFSSPYSGLCQVIKPDGVYKSQQRFGMYRFHITDPIRFEKNIKVTIQALGWRKNGYLALQDDISAVTYWYQTLPTKKLSELPSIEFLEII